jgi:hypothetical protein
LVGTRRVPWLYIAMSTIVTRVHGYGNKKRPGQREVHKGHETKENRQRKTDKGKQTKETRQGKWQKELTQRNIQREHEAR